MNIILVLNRQCAQNVRVMVKLKEEELKRKVTLLLDANRAKEAFDLILKEAEVTDYLPPGRSSVDKHTMILMEDLL